ncbi:MAG TPA: glycoside hydrolase family 3 N-terminal domain-containing protein, partial [Acidimicrobiales bacterium]|nr:glycoside hydrolase family 3 N-terminal domain-containing protein [Acidimicrobiales bacterium]
VPASTALVPTTSAPTTAPGPPSCAARVTAWPLADRLEQLLMVGAEFSDLPASSDAALAGVGGFVLFGEPPATARPAVGAGLAALRSAASRGGHPPPWLATDEEGGTVDRLADVIGALPSARRMAAQWSPEQVQLAAAEHGAAMRALGVDMDLAPVIDTAPSGDLVADEADRSFADDPGVVGAYGSAFAAGLRAGGVTPVVKHFPGLGHATGNTDLGPATGPALAALEASDLRPFQQVIAGGAPVVMVAHVAVPGLTGGVPASLAPATYAFLRGTLGFEGVALTDSLGAGAVSAAGYTEAAAAVTALEAGADMAMIDAASWWAVMAALEHAVATGALPASAVDRSAARVLRVKGACAP